MFDSSLSSSFHSFSKSLILLSRSF